MYKQRRFGGYEMLSSWLFFISIQLLSKVNFTVSVENSLGLLDILRSLKSSFPTSSDHHCLPIYTGLRNEELTVFKSMKVLTPHHGEMTSSKFQALISAEVLNYEDAVKRNTELSLCYQLFLESEATTVGTVGNDGMINHDKQWHPYYEQCGLDIFGVNMLTANNGKNRLVTSLFHQSTIQSSNGIPPRLICQSEVEFECCISLNQTASDSQQDLLMSDIDFEQHLAERYMNEIQKIVRNTTIAIDSSSRSILHSPLALRLPNNRNSPQRITVLVGIKSFALNIKIRSAIRRTWFQFNTDSRRDTSNYQIDFLPFFIIGNSSIVEDWKTHRIKQFDDNMKSISLEEAINIEQSLYNDLLLGEELDGVEDSYFHLTQKVMAFFKWTEIEKFSLADHIQDKVFVIICDDDAYLNVQDLRFYLENLVNQRHSIRVKLQDEQWENVEESNVNPIDDSHGHEAVLRPFYGGEILEKRMHHKFKPVRDPDHLHYLEESAFPFQELPPFALGNFYMLSSDAVAYLAKNIDILKPIGTLEDLSVGFWLLSIHAFPIHFPGVCEIARCGGDLTSFRVDSLTSSPHHRFFAVAGLKEPESFDSVHEAIAVVFVSENDPSEIIYDGKNRDIAKEGEFITDVYYRNIMNRLLEVDQTQRDKIKQKSAADFQNSRRVNKLGRPDKSTVYNKANKLIHKERAAKKAAIDAKRKLKHEVETASKRVMKYFFVDETGSDEVVWKPLQQSKEINLPIRIAVFIQTLDISSSELEIYRLLINELYSATSFSLIDRVVDVELVIGSRQGSMEFLELIARSTFPTRYFSPFDASLNETKEEEWLKNQVPYQSLLVRYLTSFDFIVLPQWIKDPEHKHFYLVLKTVLNRLKILQNEENAAVSKDIVLPHIIHLIAGSSFDANNSPFTSRSNTVKSDQDLVNIASLQTHIIGRVRSLGRRMRALPNSKLVEQTVLMPLTTVVFGPGSLYMKPWIEQMLLQHLPSHSQLLQTRMFQVVKNPSSPSTDYVMAKVVSVKGEYGTARQELHHLSGDDLEMLQQQPLSAGVLFVTTFLDCAEPIEGYGQRLFMNYPSSYLCLDRLHQSVQSYFGKTAMQSVRSMWFSGEAIISPASIMTQNIQSDDAVSTMLETFQEELPWLRMVFLPQSIPKRWFTPSPHKVRVFFLPTFATSFPEFIISKPTNSAAEALSEESGDWEKNLRPSRLLSPIALDASEQRMAKDSLIAYLYFRCDRPDREKLFHSLHSSFASRPRFGFSLQNGVSTNYKSESVGVHALGACHGQVEPTPHPPINKVLSSVSSTVASSDIYAQSRFGEGYNLEAVRSYHGYSFVIAGENLALEGYVTEKLTNVFLAESIPIYLGSKSVEKHFNSSSFISCYVDTGSDKYIDTCVRKVLEIVQNEIRWREILSVIPIAGVDNADRANTWLDIFYWHEDARDTTVAMKFSKSVREFLFSTNQ